MIRIAVLIFALTTAVSLFADTIEIAPLPISSANDALLQLKGAKTMTEKLGVAKGLLRELDRQLSAEKVTDEKKFLSLTSAKSMGELHPLVRNLMSEWNDYAEKQKIDADAKKGMWWQLWALSKHCDNVKSHPKLEGGESTDLFTYMKHRSPAQRLKRLEKARKEREKEKQAQSAASQAYIKYLNLKGVSPVVEPLLKKLAAIHDMSDGLALVEQYVNISLATLKALADEEKKIVDLICYDDLRRVRNATLLELRLAHKGNADQAFLQNMRDIGVLYSRYPKRHGWGKDSELKNGVDTILDKSESTAKRIAALAELTKRLAEPSKAMDQLYNQSRYVLSREKPFSRKALEILAFYRRTTDYRPKTRVEEMRRLISAVGILKNFPSFARQLRANKFILKVRPVENDKKLVSFLQTVLVAFDKGKYLDIARKYLYLELGSQPHRTTMMIKALKDGKAYHLRLFRSLASSKEWQTDGQGSYFHTITGIGKKNSVFSDFDLIVVRLSGKHQNYELTNSRLFHLETVQVKKSKAGTR